MFPFRKKSDEKFNKRKRNNQKRHQTEFGIPNIDTGNLKGSSATNSAENLTQDNEATIPLPDQGANSNTQGGIVQTLRQRFVTVGEPYSEPDPADVSQSETNNHPSPKIFKKGIVKETVDHYKKMGQNKQISMVEVDNEPRDVESIPRSKSECALVPKANRDDLTESLSTWDVVDAEDDSELREVQKNLDRMPRISRERTESIVKENALYQDLASVGSSNDYSPSPSTDTGNSEHFLEPIVETSENHKSMSLSASHQISESFPTRQPREGLWQHQESVIQSGVLDGMTTSEIKLQEALFEIIRSEESHLKTLEILVTHFKAAFEGDEAKKGKKRGKERLFQPNDSGKRAILNRYESNKLFFNIDQIKECSEKFLTSVQLLQGDEPKMVNFLNLVSESATTTFGKAVVKYCKNMSNQNSMLNNLLQSNILFAEKIADLEKDKRLNDKTFKSFLVVPLTRICHIPLLLDKVIRVSEKMSDDFSVEIHSAAKKAHELSRKIARECDLETQKLDDLAEQQNILLSIERKLIFPWKIGVNVVAHTRKFYYECDVVQVTEANIKLFSKSVETNLHLFLFTDMLVISKPAPQESYVVLDVAETDQGSVFLSEMTDDNEDDFMARAKFLSPSHRSKRPISIVFFRTKLGDPRTHQGSTMDLRAIPNCFKDHANIFVFPTVEIKNTFVTKLKEAQTDLTKQKIASGVQDEDTVGTVGVALRRNASLIRASEKDRRYSVAGVTSPVKKDKFEHAKQGGSDGESAENETKVVTKTNKLAFTPLPEKKHTNLMRYRSSIQLSQSSRFSDDDLDEMMRPTTAMASYADNPYGVYADKDNLSFSSDYDAMDMHPIPARPQSLASRESNMDDESTDLE